MPKPPRKPQPTGIIYLIHFEQKFQHAQHYVGWTQNLEQRIATHRSGNGARLLRAVAKAGIGFSVVRTWPNVTKADERAVKRRKKTSQLCPICRGDKQE